LNSTNISFVYSDMKILLADAEMVPAHKFVFEARSKYWGVDNLDSISSLGKAIYINMNKSQSLLKLTNYFLKIRTYIYCVC